MAGIDDDAIHQLRENPLEDPRSLVMVKMFNGLVEENNWSIAEQRASEIQPLCLSERQHILTDPGVEPACARETTVEFYGGKRQPAFRFGCAGREEVLTDGV